MQPLELLAYSTAGYPVIFYDQCGCGSSTRVEDPAATAPWLLTIPYYVEELALLVKALGLDVDGTGEGGTGEGEGGESGYYVYGSSWGSVLAQEVAVTRPVGLRGMVLDGALAHGQVRRRQERRERMTCGVRCAVCGVWCGIAYLYTDVTLSFFLSSLFVCLKDVYPDAVEGSHIYSPHVHPETARQAGGGEGNCVCLKSMQ